ncbi:MAG: hypothetical protein ACJ749_03810 [Flavisolibacter sp.]
MAFPIGKANFFFKGRKRKKQKGKQKEKEKETGRERERKTLDGKYKNVKRSSNDLR